MINPKKAGMWMVVIIMFILLGQIALAQSGSLKSWGYNYYGQLGDGTTTDRHTPVSVSGGITTAVSVSAGLEHTCAVLSDHTVKCWGYNDNGQLGDGTTTNSLTPVSVSGITNAINVSTSYKHTCAVLSDHTVKCWGYNDFGQLGDNTIIDKHIPVIVSGITTAVS
ncbi:MAG: hypothetical protein NT001_01100, partial [Candidatus Woesearchaeota archaeon]|nr:hypothetical protein [Candidatus Woesearchaeota archaeon]